MAEKLIYGIDDHPPRRESLLLGLQHYLTMFGSTVAIPLILAEPLGMSGDPIAVSWLIGTMFFVSGITTLLQTTWGNRLPLVQGGTFSFLAPAISICGMAALAEAGWEVRLTHVQGAVIAGSLFEMFVGYSGLVGRMLRFVGPITIAPTIALIGLALFKFGAPVAGTHWGIGGLTIVLIIVLSQYMRRTHRAFELFPIMLGIVIAWGVSWLFTVLGVFGPGHPAHVDADRLITAPWIRIPYPFQWGTPVFGAAAIVGMLAGYIASIVESVGDYYACARLAGAPVPTASIINRGIGMEGIGCFVAGVFGTGNGTTSYSENIGAIGLTRVGSRRVVQYGAALMIGLAVFGKFGALFTTIPQPIVGGMYCTMFGMITSVGLSNLQFVNLNSARNLFILGFTFFMGLSMPEYIATNPVDFDPRWAADILNTLGSTSMAIGAFIALILDNTIPGTDEERGLTAWRVGVMMAMVLERPGSPLIPVELETPTPGPDQVQIRVSACAICRTDLHVIDGDLPDPGTPLILGHEIVGRVSALGPGVSTLAIGDRVGVPWLGETCGECGFCRTDRENLCDHARFTGYQIDGGYAEYTVAAARYCLPIPHRYTDAEAAPLLCAGLIGHRSYRMAGDGRRLGLYGFGAAAHIIAQVAVHQGRDVFAFTRPGDEAAQEFAARLGAAWTGDSETLPPHPLDAAIIFAPVGSLVPAALRAVAKGGRVICAGIHMSDIPAFPYSILWEERTIGSVANLTRRDGLEFFSMATEIPIRTAIETLPLTEANEGLGRLREGRVQGALVLVP